MLPPPLPSLAYQRLQLIFDPAAWSTIWSVYPSWPYFGNGLMCVLFLSLPQCFFVTSCACTPSRPGAATTRVRAQRRHSLPPLLLPSSSAAVNPTIWTTAHTTQVPSPPPPPPRDHSSAAKKLSRQHFPPRAVCAAGLESVGALRPRHVALWRIMDHIHAAIQPHSGRCPAQCSGGQQEARV